MNKLKVMLDFGKTRYNAGTLFHSEKMGRYAFSYEKDFLRSGLEISPINMPLGPDTYTAEKNSDLYDLHGVFADSLPDAWGKKVQDAEFEKIGMREISALERLAFVGRFGIGALRYEPAEEFHRGKEAVSLAVLRKAAQSILSGEIESIARELLHSGGSAGGARPKFLVDLDVENHTQIRYSTGQLREGMCPVVLKVPGAKDDPYQRIEYAYSIMARQAGIRVPETYLLFGIRSKTAFYAIERFDIQKNGERLHTHTFAGLLGANYREARLDYSEFLRTVENLTRDHREVIEAYKRMIFNYLGCNKDDHAKNFTFIMNNNGEWSLSPMYDMGYSSGENGLHAMAINGIRRNATMSDFEKVAEYFDITDWKNIVAKISDALNTWPNAASAAGIPSKHQKIIQERIKESVKRLK